MITNKKYFITFMFLLSCSICCVGQHNLDYASNRLKYALYNGNVDIDDRTFDIENSIIYDLSKNFCFYEYRHDLKQIVKSYGIKTKQGFISSIGRYDVTSADYLHYEGNKDLKIEVLAGGDTRYNNLGTFYGNTSYARNEKHNIYLNTVADAKVYLPYISSDTVSKGKYNDEDYLVSGGFAFKNRNTYYAINGLYNGLVTYGLKDPRSSSYNAWAVLNLGTAKIINQKLYSLNVIGEQNRQYISLRDFGQMANKYFLFYGFGMWDRRESSASYSHFRMMYVNGLGADISFSNIPLSNHRLLYSFNIEYKVRKMMTEESSKKNLYSSLTHTINPNIYIKKNIGTARYVFAFKGYNIFRKGQENIYENYKVKDDANIYNYRKIGSNTMYSMMNLSNSIFFKALWNRNSNNVIHFLSYINYSKRVEEYMTPNNLMINEAFTPGIGVGISGCKDKFNYSLNLQFYSKIPIYNFYNVPHREDKADYQFAFIPYSFYSSKSSNISSVIKLSYCLPSDKEIGVNIMSLFSFVKRTELIKDENIIGLIPNQLLNKNVRGKRTLLNINIFLLF